MNALLRRVRLRIMLLRMVAGRPLSVRYIQRTLQR